MKKYFKRPPNIDVTEDANEMHKSGFFRETKWDWFIQNIGLQTLSAMSDTISSHQDLKVLKFLKLALVRYLGDINTKLQNGTIPEVLRRDIMNTGSSEDQPKKMFNPITKSITKYADHISLVLFMIIRGLVTFSEDEVDSYDQLFDGCDCNQVKLYSQQLVAHITELADTANGSTINIEPFLFELFKEDGGVTKPRNNFVLVRGLVYSCYMRNGNSFCETMYIGQRLAALKFVIRGVIANMIVRLGNEPTAIAQRFSLLKYTSKINNNTFIQVSTLKTLAAKYSNEPRRANMRFTIDPKTHRVNYNEMIVGNGEKVAIEDFKNGFLNLKRNMEVLLKKLSKGMQLDILVDKPIVDNIPTNDAGYCFLSDPRNKFDTYAENMLKHLHPIFLSTGESSNSRNPIIQKWLELCDEFEEYMALSFYLAGGAPCRASELPSVLLSNCADLSRRGIYWHYDTISWYQHYHKSRNVQNSDTNIMRFMEKGLATTVLQYLVYFRPIQRYEQSVIDLTFFF
jgi:hypothetical protein